MNIFTKKEKIVLRSEQQKDDFIERLEKAHVDYDIHEDKENSFGNDIAYIVRIPAADMKKVV